MFLRSRGENHLDLKVKEAILLQELRHEDLQTSHTKVKWVKKLGLLNGDLKMGFPINFYYSNLEWSAAAQLICNLDANITIH